MLIPKTVGESPPFPVARQARVRLGSVLLELVDDLVQEVSLADSDAREASIAEVRLRVAKSGESASRVVSKAAERGAYDVYVELICEERWRMAKELVSRRDMHQIKQKIRLTIRRLVVHEEAKRARLHAVFLDRCLFALVANGAEHVKMGVANIAQRSDRPRLDNR